MGPDFLTYLRRNVARASGFALLARMFRVRVVRAALITFDAFHCRPYRAPETLFGARGYNPFELDLWSLGATVAEFFTPLRFMSDDDPEDGSSDEENEGDGRISSQPPFINWPSVGERGAWVRESLFDAQRGSIGLAWSIFKVRGTANDENWPVCLDTISHSPCLLTYGYLGF